MKIVSAELSEKGPVRSLNADAIFCDAEEGFLAVADGVGSTLDSADASSFAVAEAYRQYNSFRTRENAVLDFETLFRDIAAAYDERFSSYSVRPKTTLSFGCFTQSAFNFCSIGDSPIFIIQENQITLLTHKHTVVDQFKTFSDFAIMKTFSGANILYNCLGQEGALPNIYAPIMLAPTDRIVIASDGIFDFLSQRDLFRISHISRVPAEFVESVSRIARDAYPTDNYSLIIAEIAK